MSKRTVLLLFLTNVIWRPMAPIVVFFLLLFFVKKTDQVTTHYNQDPIQRYRLPDWLAWVETPDEHLPGGMYEPTMWRIYDRYGWFISSLVWLGFRNVGHGIPWPEGFEAPNFRQKLTQAEKDELGFIDKEKKILIFKILWGHTVYTDHYNLQKTSSGLWAVPRFTIRLASQD